MEKRGVQSGHGECQASCYFVSGEVVWHLGRISQTFKVSHSIYQHCLYVTFRFIWQADSPVRTACLSGCLLTISVFRKTTCWKSWSDLEPALLMLLLSKETVPHCNWDMFSLLTSPWSEKVDWSLYSPSFSSCACELSPASAPEGLFDNLIELGFQLNQFSNVLNEWIPSTSQLSVYNSGLSPKVIWWWYTAPVRKCSAWMAAACCD